MFRTLTLPLHPYSSYPTHPIYSSNPTLLTLPLHFNPTFPTLLTQPYLSHHTYPTLPLQHYSSYPTSLTLSFQTILPPNPPFHSHGTPALQPYPFKPSPPAWSLHHRLQEVPISPRIAEGTVMHNASIMAGYRPKRPGRMIAKLIRQLHAHLTHNEKFFSISCARISPTKGPGHNEVA